MNFFFIPFIKIKMLEDILRERLKLIQCMKIKGMIFCINTCYVMFLFLLQYKNKTNILNPGWKLVGMWKYHVLN